MNGALIPFIAEAQHNIPIKQMSTKASGDAKSQNGSAFNSVLASAVTTNAAGPPPKSGNTADKDNPSETAATADTTNLAALMQQTIPLPIPPPVEPQTVGAVVQQGQTISTINTISAVNVVAAFDPASQASSQTLTSPLTAAQTPGANLSATDAQPLVAAALLNANQQSTATQTTPGPIIPVQTPLPTDPKLTSAILVQQPLPTSQQNVGLTPVVATTSATAPTLTTAAAPTPQQLPQQAAVEIAGQPPAALVTSSQPGSQPQPVTIGKVIPTHIQNLAPTIPAPSGQDQTAATAPVGLHSAAQTVAATQDSKPGNNDDALSAGNLFVTDTAGDKPETSTNMSTSFVGILDQQISHANQSTAPATETPQAARPDPYDIAGQIVEQAKLITRPQNSEMIIRLKPEHLGDLTMRIVVENGTVSAAFHSSNPDVRAALEASQTQFRQDMSNQGIKINHVGIYASLDQFSGNQQRSFFQQQEVKINPQSRDNQEAIEAAEAVSSAAAAGLTTTSGIDYRV